MDFKKFKAFNIADKIERRWLSVAVIGLLIANTLLAVNAFSTRTILTIMPPGINEEAEIAIDRANAPYIKGWGMFTAQLLGNVQPEQTDFILSILKPMLSAKVFRPVVDAIHAQIAQIKEDEISVSFTPDQVKYDADKNLVYVTGKSISAGPGSDPVSERRTYEFEFVINHYRPLIKHISVYDGRPHTKENKE